MTNCAFHLNNKTLFVIGEDLYEGYASAIRAVCRATGMADLHAAIYLVKLEKGLTNDTANVDG